MPADRKAVQRLGMFLVRRGFDPETVRRALREAALPDQAGDETSDDD
jgi:SOS response regulatory protein OraA/RecX